MRRRKLLCLLALLAGLAPVLAAGAGDAWAAKRIAVGAYVPGAERDPGQLDAYAAATGRQPQIVHIYDYWSDEVFDHGELAAVSSRGGVPMVSWEPWGERGEAVSLWGIADGAYDAYLVAAARRAAEWGGPILIRFGHEMNGGWYPWGRGNNGNTPAAFKAAWRHLVKVFRWAGARNARWVWSPYVAGRGLSFKRFYPGDRWVDWVALDGFNWGRPFVSFAKIFRASYRIVVRMTRRKPVMIAETGSVESGGDKAAWVRQAMRRTLPRFKRVHALVWWNAVHPDGPDMRVWTSDRALAALRRGLRARYFSMRAAPKKRKRTRARASAGRTASASAAGRHRIALGTYIHEAGRHPGRIGRYARLMGRRPVIVSDYKQWDYAPFVGRELRAIWRRGAVPMITWEPLSYHGRRYPLRAIARGRFDPYVRRAARAAAAWDKPILLRFAHEMNGGWYPWGRGVEGNTPGRYKRAWRRLVRIFRRAGAGNVRWVWTPNVNQGGGLPFKRFYPGDRWVDWAGLDGFNWGHGGRSYSFRQIFGRSYRSLARLSSKPLMIAETGAYRDGRARWISQALRRQLPRMRRIKALVWFNRAANRVDLRFDGTRPGLRAFRAAARKGIYATTRARLLATRR